MDELTDLLVPVKAVDRLVHSKPELAREIGRAIDRRRQRVLDAIRTGGPTELTVVPRSVGRRAADAYRGAR